MSGRKICFSEIISELHQTQTLSGVLRLTQTADNLCYFSKHELFKKSRKNTVCFLKGEMDIFYF